MNRKTLIDEIAEQSALKKNTVGTVLDAFVSTLQLHAENDEYITLRGFGSFYLKKKAAKVARIISRNESITIPPHYAITFRPAKGFKRQVMKALGENHLRKV